MTDPMPRPLKLAVLIFFVSFSLSVSAARPQLPPAWDGSPARFDSRTYAYMPPVRIVAQDEPGLISGCDLLLESGNGQSDLQNARICVLRSRDGRRPGLLLDFGRELQGGLRIVTGMPADNRPVRVRIRFGESVSETMCDIDGVNGASNDHAVRDFTLALPWLGTVECGDSGFRFARIDLLDDDRELHLKQVEAVFQYRDIPYVGSFRSSDERLDRIWATGAYTVHLCMQEFLWDGVKRDRLVWVGDLHPEIMTVNSVFGYNEVVPRSLDLARDTTPLPGWMNGISSYSLWWIIIHSDWYRYHGDRAYLAEQRPYLTALLRQIFGKIGPDGRERLDGTRFLDWPSSDDAASTAAGLQSLTILALDAGAGLCDALGDAALAAECRTKAALMRNCPVGDGGEAKQGRSLMVLAGLADPAETDRDYISKGGSNGFSTFYGYYMLRAMAAAGNYEGALERIREYWGAMLDLGATTFWEDFDMAWLPAGRFRPGCATCTANAGPIATRDSATACATAGRRDRRHGSRSMCWVSGSWSPAAAACVSTPIWATWNGSRELSRHLTAW